MGAIGDRHPTSRQCQEFPALVRLGAALSGGVSGDPPGCPWVREVLHPWTWVFLVFGGLCDGSGEPHGLSGDRQSPSGGRNHRWDHCAAVRLPIPAATPYGHDVYIAV